MANCIPSMSDRRLWLCSEQEETRSNIVADNCKKRKERPPPQPSNIVLEVEGVMNQLIILHINAVRNARHVMEEPYRRSDHV